MNVLYEASFRLDGSLLIPLILMILIPFIPKKPWMSRKDVRIIRVLQVCGMVMAVFVFSCFLSDAIDLYNTSVKAYRSGNYEIVEGYVENFVPMPKEGHARESFDIDGVYFEYSENSIPFAYSQTKPHGGVIRNGLYLRVGYVLHPAYGNIIVCIVENPDLSKEYAPGNYDCNASSPLKSDEDAP